MSDAGNSDLGGSAPPSVSEALATGDSFTETTSTSWFRRAAGSFVGAVIGLLLVIAAIVAIFWNEGRAIATARALSEGAGSVVSVEAGAVDPANEGKLVHVSGPASATAPLVDPQFQVKASGLKLLRKVEMYQWREDKHSQTRDKLGGGQETVTTYSYSRVWKDRRNDSSAFRHPEGHANPEMAFSARQFVAADAKLGAFSLPPALLDQLGGATRLDVDPQGVSAPSGQTRPQQAVDGAIYLGVDPAAPHVGDLRISYTFAPNGPISAIGRQAGASLAPYQTKAGGLLYLIDAGDQTAAAMFKQAESENALLTWIVRAVALVAMLVGFAFMLGPLSVLAAVIPPLGSLVGFGVTLTSLVLTLVLGPLLIAVAWFAVRPLMAIGIVVAGFVVAFGVSRLRGPRPAAPRRA